MNRQLGQIQGGCRAGLAGMSGGGAEQAATNDDLDLSKR